MKCESKDSVFCFFGRSVLRETIRKKIASLSVYRKGTLVWRITLVFTTFSFVEVCTENTWRKEKERKKTRKVRITRTFDWSTKLDRNFCLHRNICMDANSICTDYARTQHKYIRQIMATWIRNGERKDAFRRARPWLEIAFSLRSVIASHWWQHRTRESLLHLFFLLLFFFP